MANYDSRNIRIAILVLVAILLSIFGMAYLKGSPIFSNNNNYYSKFSQASGLQVANKVYLLGVEIGQVEDIEFINNFEQVKVTYSIKNNISIPEHSKMAIDAGIPGLGSPSLRLSLGDGTSYLPTNSEIESIKPSSLSDQAMGIVDNVEPTIKSLNHALGTLDTTLNNFNSLFSGQNAQNIEQSFASLNKTLQNFQSIGNRVDNLLLDQEVKISAILGNVQSISQNLANNQERINLILNNLSTTSQNLSAVKLDETLTNVNTALASLTNTLENINQGDGSLSLLLNDAELYNNLNNAARDLDLLILSIKEQPDEYVPDVTVFGRKKK